MLSVRKVRGSIPGPVKLAQFRQRLATAATFLCSPGAKSRKMGHSGVRTKGAGRVGSSDEKNKQFF